MIRVIMISCCLALLLQLVYVSTVFSSPARLSNTTVNLTVPDTFSTANRKEWQSIQRVLLDSPSKYFIIRWEGFGGLIDSGIEFIKVVQAAQKQGKKITMLIVGNTYSMHSMAVCFGDVIRFTSPNILMMFHRPSKAPDTRFECMGSIKAQKWIFDTCRNKGLIPDSVFEKVESGEIVYVYPEQKKMYEVPDDRKICPWLLF